MQSSRSDPLDEPAAVDRWMRGVPAYRRHLGASAHVHELRQDRLLRLLTQPPRDGPRPRVGPSDHPLGGAGRGLELVLRRRGCLRGRWKRGNSMSAVAVALPPLPLDEWEATKNTLHLWCQIVGKIRLTSTAPRNHWW